MSETARTLIKSALRKIGAIATGETPSSEDMADGLEALQVMLRMWSGDGMMIYFIDQETLTMNGSVNYTIGSGGDLNTSWPHEIVGATVDDERVLRQIGEAEYRRVSLSDRETDAGFFWYNPEYPLGLFYPWPQGGDSAVLDLLKPLTEPTAITDSVQFPPPYDAAIIYNLAIHMAPEFGKEPSLTVLRLADQAMAKIENHNLANRVNNVDMELIRLNRPSLINYDIDEG